MSEQLQATPAYEKACFSYENKVEDILQAAEVMDKKNRVESRRNIQGLGLVVVLWMFIPDLFEDPTRLTSWLMIAAAAILLVFVWKYPEKANRTFAQSKVEHAPSCEMTIGQEEIQVTEGPAHFSVPFSGSIAVFDYKDVFAVVFDRNRLLTIPKKQLDEAMLERVKHLFSEGLGERFEKVEDYASQKSMFGRKKR